MWPALITGGASMLGSIFGAETSASNTQSNIQAQQQMQLQNEQYMTQMSNTAYQRASADMKAAGLNPMMMFGSGGPASTPSPGTPNMALNNKQSPFAGIGEAVKSGLSAMVTSKTLDKMGEEIANLQADNTKMAAQTDLIKATTGGQAQRNVINLPDETKAQLFNDWLRKHPNLTTAAEVGGYGGQQASKAAAPVFDAVGGVVNSALRKQGVDLLRDRMNATKSYTEHYDVRPGGYTRSGEEWLQ